MSKRPLKDTSFEEMLDMEELEDMSEYTDSDNDPDYEPEQPFRNSDSNGGEFIEFEDIDEELQTLSLEETDDEEEQEDNPVPKWSSFSNRIQTFPFTGRSGVIPDLNPSITPIEVYDLFFDDEIMDLIMTQTNLYARQVFPERSQTLKGKGRYQKWVPTTVEELRTFFGIIIWMGLFRAGAITDYWRNHPLYKNAISEKMSRNRFQLLLACLHFADNSQLEEGNRIGEIEKLLNMLIKKFQSVYEPGEDVVIDETLVPWRGRVVFRQFIPNKAHKYGIKLFKLCSTEGYTYNLSVYTGKSPEGTRQVGMAKTVCTDLMQNLLNKGRTLYVDNFYTSYELAYSFLQQKTHVVGTLRAKKKNMPADVMSAVLKKGEMKALEDTNGIIVMKWKDVRDVRILSTKHRPEFVEVGGNRTADIEEAGPSNLETRQDKGRKTVKKPLGVIAYNKGKIGIDISDQMASYETSLRKGIKWFRKLAISLLLGMSVVNAWIVFKNVRGNKMQLKLFKEQIAMALLKYERPTVTLKKPPYTPHLLLEKKDGNKKIRKRCKQCYAKIAKEKGREEARKHGKNVHTYCSSCPGEVFLCLECFNDVHK